MMVKITITNDGEKTLLHAEGTNCCKRQVLMAAEDAYLSLLDDILKKGMTSAEQEECAREFGEMMEKRLLQVMRKEKCKVYTTTGKEASFLQELMKRQGEVQNG